MTVRLFVPLAGTLIFAWLVTTYFWAVPVDNYLRATSPVVSAVAEEQELVSGRAEKPVFIPRANSDIGARVHEGVVSSGQ